MKQGQELEPYKKYTNSYRNKTMLRYLWIVKSTLNKIWQPSKRTNLKNYWIRIMSTMTDS